MDEFLRVLNVGMVKRSIATKVVEGLNGKLKIKIQQVENSIKFTTIGPNDPEGVTNEFTIGRSDNVNENAFLGKMVADLHWEVSTQGRCTLVADMKGEDGKTAQLRRSLIGGADYEILLMETIVDGASMSQRYECESRPVLHDVVQTAAQHESASQAHAEVLKTAAPETDDSESAGDQTVASADGAELAVEQQTMQSAFETCTVHLDYIQSKFPWPLASEYAFCVLDWYVLT